MTDPNRLIDAYLDGTLSNEELDQLEHDLATNPKYADAFAAAMMISELLGQRFEQESIAKTLQLADGSFIGEADLQHLQDDYDHAQPELVSLGDDTPIHIGPAKRGKEENLSFAEALSAIGYGVKCLVRAKPKPFIATGLAALLLITLWLINPFAASDPDPQAFTDNNPTKPAESAQPILRDQALTPVATLTDQHNATWASGDLAPGSQPRPGDALAAGQRLNLTEGFAEITTGSGAVATIEAPATVELIDSPNALHLHAGKLVGVCETDASKGFLVRTPQADITDLGTVFVVQCDERGGVTTGVIRGRTALSIPGHPGKPRQIDAGQLLRVSERGQTSADLDPAGLQQFRSMAAARRPVRVVGDAVLFEHMPPVIGTNDAFVQVFREATDVPIDQPITVSRTQAGLYQPQEAEQATLQAGGRVDSYLVHFDRPGTPIDRVVKQFAIQFEQSVVAMILNRRKLMDTDARFGVSGVSYPNGPRGMDDEVSASSDGGLDSIELSEDRKTLTIKLNAADMDSLRVLTQSPPAVLAEGAKP